MPPSAPAELARLQRGFLALATGRRPRSRAAREALREVDGADARERVAVYCDMYALRMAREVAREFPATRAVLGAAKFARIARAYVAAHPSTSFTLEGYAAALPELLRGKAAAVAATERSIWQKRGTRIRVATREAGLLRALLRGAALERAVAIAAESGLTPREIRAALEHWVGSGLFGSRLPRNLARHLPSPSVTDRARR